MSVKKRFPKKPFEFGRYIIEYRESRDAVLRFLKERLDTFDEAKIARDKLLSQGCTEPVIKKVG
jgi:hypothetical protein|tara:strand:+ start:1499 stop:1690 length:192 start_codon:yes stop_codon:yes gene_type:complete